MIIPDKLYNVLKWISILAIPVITFISGILTSTLPSDTAAFVISIVTAVIGGLGTLAGIIIKQSDTNYKAAAAELEKTAYDENEVQG